MDLDQMMNHFNKQIKTIFPPDSKIQSNAKEGGGGVFEVNMGKSEIRIEIAGKVFDSYKNASPEQQKGSDKKFIILVRSSFRDGDTELKVDDL